MIERARVSSWQLFLLMGGVPLVAAVLRTPALAYQAAEHSQWKVLAAMYLLTTPPLLLLGMELQRFPGLSAAGLCRRIYGRWLGALLALPLTGFFFATAVGGLRGLTELTALTLLPATPERVLLVVFSLTSFYLVLQGPEMVARTAEVFLMFVAPLGLSIVAAGFRDIDPAYLRPAFDLRPDFLARREFYMLVPAFLGPALAAAWAPAVAERSRICEPIFWANTVGLVFLAVALMLPLGTLGLETVRTLDFPLVFKMETVLTYFFFLERLTYALVALWAFLIIYAVSAFWLAGSALLAELLGVSSHRPVTWGSLPVLLAGSWALLETRRYYLSYVWWGPLGLGAVALVTLACAAGRRRRPDAGGRREAG